MPPRQDADAERHQRRCDRLGLALTFVMGAAFFGFIGLGAYRPGWMLRPLVAGGVLPLGFAAGLGVIALGVVATAVYVAVANGMPPRRRR